jgi:hypothetical protein
MEKGKRKQREWDEIVALEKLLLKNKDKIAEVTGMKNQMFLHRSCKPISEIDFDQEDKQVISFMVCKTNARECAAINGKHYRCRFWFNTSYYHTAVCVSAFWFLS